MKEMLAHWVSLALQKVLSSRNIQSGFRHTSIFPLNRQATDKYMALVVTYRQDDINSMQSWLPEEAGE